MMLHAKRQPEKKKHAGRQAMKKNTGKPKKIRQQTLPSLAYKAAHSWRSIFIP